jgi:hypothetical protein
MAQNKRRDIIRSAQPLIASLFNARRVTEEEGFEVVLQVGRNLVPRKIRVSAIVAENQTGDFETGECLKVVKEMNDHAR